MHRLGLTLTLLTLLPSAALALGQHPGDPVRPHPATGAQARASAAVDAARRMEACGQLARAFLDQLLQGHYAAARRHLSTPMQTALGSTGLGSGWRSLTADLGPLQARGPMQTLLVQSIPVAATPLTFTRGSMSAQWTCSAHGRLTSFQLQPLTVPMPAPASPSSS